jgi:UDPglucose 6-dehydrogenase
VKLSVVGCGYLGAVHAAAMAALGHSVVGVDVDAAKIARLAAGEAPFFEPGLAELLAEVGPTGRLHFTTDLAAAAGAEVHFVCVGTPQLPGGEAADLSYVDAAMAGLATLLADKTAVVAGKSTVPVGTAARWAERFSEAAPGVTLAWNPEFLREGFAVADTLHPDRLVYGLPAGAAGERARAALDAVYAPLLAEGVPQVVTDLATAELVKAAANSFLATKISFINAMAEICEQAGGDVYSLATALGLDPRIGSRFLRPGIGFGGGCLPKDIRAFTARAEEIGAGAAVGFLREVDAVNLRARRRMADLIARAVSADPADLAGRRIGVLGAAFKPDSDDTRDSPALVIARDLAARGAEVSVYDPAVGLRVAELAPELHAAACLADAAGGAEALAVLTEWREFRDLEPAAVAPLVARKVILDGRGALDPARWRSAGWLFRRLGAV